MSISHVVVLAVLLLCITGQVSKVPVWTRWSAWTACTKACDGGSQTRRRTCKNGVLCLGVASELQTCNRQVCFGKWSAWSVWSACDKPCALGRTSRTRLCLGGEKCIPAGGGRESKLCNIQPCPIGDWSQWTEWSPCSRTCLGGRRQKKRLCQGIEKGSTCPGLAEMSEVCGVGVCGAPEGFWQSWLSWTVCSKSCGGGVRRRTRVCFGGPCREGRNIEDGECNTERCSSWEPWSQWSECSVTCGSGQLTRTRSCDGSSCVGLPSESRPCNKNPCPLLDLANILSSPMGTDQILSMVTNLFTGLLQNPGSLLSSLGLGGGGGSGGLMSFGNLIGPLINAIPFRTGLRAGRTKTETNTLIRKGLQNALRNVNKKSVVK